MAMTQLGFGVPWPRLLLFCLCGFRWFSSLQGQPVQDLAIHCSRERSRTAWKIIDEYLLPFVERERYNLSSACRLHPYNDIFREQESKKEHLTTNQWQCHHCKKVFRSEKFLDQHFDNRHSDILNFSRDRCLADMCGALHCDYYDGLSQSKPKRRKCNPLTADRKLHLCEKLAKSCFPSEESPTARRLHDFFLRQFCDAHTCKRGLKPFRRGSGRSGDAALYIAVIFFLSLLLLLFYGGIYAHKRELSKNIQEMRRISKPKPH